MIMEARAGFSIAAVRQDLCAETRRTRCSGFGESGSWQVDN